MFPVIRLHVSGMALTSVHRNALNQFGEYGAAIADLNDPSVLQVCLQVPSGQTGSIDITALNSPFGTNTPFFGGSLFTICLMSTKYT